MIQTNGTYSASQQHQERDSVLQYFGTLIYKDQMHADAELQIALTFFLNCTCIKLKPQFGAVRSRCRRRRTWRRSTTSSVPRRRRLRRRPRRASRRGWRSHLNRSLRRLTSGERIDSDSCPCSLDRSNSSSYNFVRCVQCKIAL